MISVIILGRNKADLSRKCLESLLSSSVARELEIIFVDNASTDETQNMVETFSRRHERFVYKRNEENLSFSRANNEAAALATGDLLLFLNNDVTVGEFSVQRLVDPLRNGSGAGVTGARLLYPDTGKIQHAGISYMLWGYISNYGVGGDRSDPRFNEMKDIFAVTGAMQLIDRSLFESIGGFHEEYLWGFEDVDLCLKAREAGRKVVYVPEAESLHWESATLKSRRKSEEVKKNYAAFRRRWDHILIDRENKFMDSLKREKTRRVAVYGVGEAARGLRMRLEEGGFEVAGFTSSFEKDWGGRYLGLSILPPTEVSNLRADTVMVASQYYFEIEKKAASLGIRDKLTLPLVW